MDRRTQNRYKERFRAQYCEYEESVLSGRRLAGHLEKLMIQRQRKDLLRRDWVWVWNWDKALAPLLWMVGSLRFPDGTKRGSRLVLEPWQVYLVCIIFGWVHRDRGTRRFLDAYVEVARKNGKSTLMGAISDYMAFSRAENHGTPCVICATSLDQAGECFGRAAKALSLSVEDMKAEGLQIGDSKNNKEIRFRGNRIVAISAAPKDGKLPHCVICDEYHQHRSNDLLNSLTSGMVSDPEALTFRITTAGTELNGVCKMEHDKCVRILEGLDIPRYFVCIYTIDDDDGIEDPRIWEKANPNYGVSVDEDTLQARFDYCKPSETDLIDFQTKNLNRWVHGNTRWCNMTLWNELCCDPFNYSELEGRQCYAGLDLASVSDFAAFAVDFPIEGEHYMTYHYWIPEENMVELEHRLMVPLRQWVMAGFVTATPGPVIDYQMIADWITVFREKHELVQIAADRWKLESLARLMPDWFEGITAEYSQGMKTMSAGTREYERLYLTGHVHSGGNPVTRWMHSCADAFTDSSGNVKLVKPRYKASGARIDGVIASIMAVDTAVHLTALDTSNLVDALSFM